MFFFLVAFAVFCGFTQFFYFKNEMKHQSLSAIDYMNNHLDNRFGYLELLAVSAKKIHEELGDDAFLDYVLSVINSSELVSEFGIYKDGIYRYVNENEQGHYRLDLEKSNIYKSSLESEHFSFTDFYISKTTKKESFSITIEVPDSAFVLIEMPLSSFFDGFSTLSGDYYNFVISPSGTLIYHPEPERLGTKATSLTFYDYKGTDVVYGTYVYKGVNKFAYVSKNNQFGWAVVSSGNFITLFQEISGIIISLFIFVVIPLGHFIFFVFKPAHSDAVTDGLTKMYTRNSFSDKDIDDQVVALCFLDIDHFKSINDTYGHSIGDKAIEAFSKCVLSNIRYCDTAFRWGGEEFLIVLRGRGDVDTFLAMDRLRKKVQAINIDEIPNFTISIGLCDFQKGGHVYTCVKNADEALYQAKKEGRNRVVKYIKQ